MGKPLLDAPEDALHARRVPAHALASPLSPTDARLIVDHVLLPSLRQEHEVTQRMLAMIPAGALGYRPAPGMRTLGDLVRHLVLAELEFLSLAVRGWIGTGSLDLDAAWGPADIARYRAARAGRLLDELGVVPGAQLLRPREHGAGPRLPAMDFARLALHHTLHHRGQVSVYLRALGLVPPASA